MAIPPTISKLRALRHNEGHSTSPRTGWALPGHTLTQTSAQNIHKHVQITDRLTRSATRSKLFVGHFDLIQDPGAQAPGILFECLSLLWYGCIGFWAFLPCLCGEGGFHVFYCAYCRAQVYRQLGCFPGISQGGNFDAFASFQSSDAHACGMTQSGEGYGSAFARWQPEIPPRLYAEETSSVCTFIVSRGPTHRHLDPSLLADVGEVDFQRFYAVRLVCFQVHRHAWTFALGWSVRMLTSGLRQNCQRKNPACLTAPRKLWFCCSIAELRP